MTRFTRTVGADQPVGTARRLMRDGGVEWLPVLDAGRLVGLVSLQGLASAELARGRELLGARVDSVMSTNPYVVTPETPLAEVARHMADTGETCAVVVEDDCVVGLLPATEAVRALLGPGGAAKTAAGVGRA